MTRDPLHVATLNLRYFCDRWDQRLPLVLADMRALQPDLMGLQEVVFPLQQDRLMGAAGPAHYQALRGMPAEPEIGNSLLVRQSLPVVDEERLDLTLGRYAIAATVLLPGGWRVRVAVTHLHHVVADEAVRDEQAAALLAWLDRATAADASILVGDLNGEPREAMYRRIAGAGFRSAFVEANGAEPLVTWPSGLQPPAPGEYDPGCFDYIWVRGRVEVVSARLVFDRPDVHDPGLYPSDHFGLSARLLVGDR